MLFSNIQLLDRDRFEPILLLPSQGPILPFLSALGVDYTIWGQQHEPNGLVRYARAVFEAVSFFKRKRVALLHINHSNYWRPAEILAAKMLRIPVITHYHVVVPEPGPFVALSNLIAAVSKYTAEHSAPRSVPKIVIHNSVDVTRFDRAVDIRHELGFCVDDVVVTFIGQIRAMKGIDLFISMTRAIRDEKVKFLIAGECRDPRRFEGAYSEDFLRAEIVGDARIRYVGYRTDVENMYRASDIIVLPSRSGEPFGLINIEAGAAHRPIVASSVGGVPEVIREGENGLLFDPDNIDSLIAGVRRLIDDKNLRVEMGARARAVVEREFTVKPIRKLESAYDRLIHGQ